MDVETFKQRLQDSRRAVFRVAEWIHRGSKLVPSRTIIIPPIMYEGGPDDGDLFVESADGKRLKIEVKHKLGHFFTCAEDYVFDTLIVSNAITVERNWGTVEAYIIVNTPMTHAAVVPWSSHENWFHQVLVIPAENKSEKFVMCAKEQATFVKITE